MKHLSDTSHLPTQELPSPAPELGRPEQEPARDHVLVFATELIVLTQLGVVANWQWQIHLSISSSPISATPRESSPLRPQLGKPPPNHTLLKAEQLKSQKLLRFIEQASPKSTNLSKPTAPLELLQPSQNLCWGRKVPHWDATAQTNQPTQAHTAAPPSWGFYKPGKKVKVAETAIIPNSQDSGGCFLSVMSYPRQGDKQSVPWVGTGQPSARTWVWRLGQFGVVTLMHSVLLCGHRPLSVNKIGDDFLYPMGFLDATISIWEDFKTQECKFIDTAVRKAEKLSSLKLPASLAVQCWYKTTEDTVLEMPFPVSS